MTFDELSTAMINHFASRATQWRIRQTLSQLRQLQKESVADYSYNVRNLCARLRSECNYSDHSKHLGIDLYIKYQSLHNLNPHYVTQPTENMLYNDKH